MANEVSDIFVCLQGKRLSKLCRKFRWPSNLLNTTGFQAIILVTIMSRPLSVVVVIIVVVVVVVVVGVAIVMHNLRHDFD